MMSGERLGPWASCYCYYIVPSNWENLKLELKLKISLKPETKYHDTNVLSAFQIAFGS